MQKCLDRSENITNRKLGHFCIEAIPKKFFQLRKNYFFETEHFFEKNEKISGNEKSQKNSMKNHMNIVIDRCEVTKMFLENYVFQ